MSSSITGNLGTIAAYLRAVEAECRPGSRTLSAFRRDAREVAVAGVRRGIAEGVGPGGTRYTTAELAPGTLRHRPGAGPPRAPRGEASRLAQGVAGEWREEAGTTVLDVSVRGVAFAPHLLGRWPAAVHPDDLRRLRERFNRVPDEIRKNGGGR
jgi:hypothetical protein